MTDGETAQALGPKATPNPTPSAEVLTPATVEELQLMPKRDEAGRFISGPSHNPGGVPSLPRLPHPLIAALEAAIDPVKLAEKAASMAMAGSEVMVKYTYDRICGSPVQRHEAKLSHEVDQTSTLIAERYGMSVEEVRRRAKALSAGA